MTNFRNEWKDKSIAERIACALYPANATQQDRKDMAARSGGKKAPHGPTLLANEKRGAVSPLGGVAERK
jgi:hypothetical protein